MSNAGPPVRVFLSAGSNIEPEHNLRSAVASLRRRYGRLELSPVYRSAPVGFEGEDFLNLVIAFDTHDAPRQLLAFFESLHTRAGRVRPADRMTPHPLDLDLLLYGDRVCDELRLPRDDITRYAFVLAPMADLAPGHRHPVNGRTMQALWADFDRDSQPVSRESLALD